MAAEEKPETGHIQSREGHVGSTNLKRCHIIAESTERQRHDGEEDHDGSMHRSKGVVQISLHDTAVDHVRTKQFLEERPNQRNWLIRFCQLLAHDQHQHETKKQEHQRGDTVLDADDFVIGTEDIFRPKALLMVMLFVRMTCARSWG